MVGDCVLMMKMFIVFLSFFTYQAARIYSRYKAP